MAIDKRLIDANALIKEAHWIIRSDGTRVFAVHAEDVDNAPTVDAVEVVRCKDCKRYSKSPMGGNACITHYYWRTDYIPRKDNDFCSRGERRSDV